MPAHAVAAPDPTTSHGASPHSHGMRLGGAVKQRGAIVAGLR
jgi:hypothetical protein